MAEIPKEMLAEIPFLRQPLVSPPILTTLQFFVDGQWRCWLPVDQRLVEIDTRPSEADYFGDRRERDTDQHFSLLDMMAQRTLDNAMIRPFRALWNDYQGMGASLAKMRLLYEHRASEEYGIRRCVQTEIENLAVLCRSTFDVLQDLVRLHIERFQMLNANRPQKLPDRFAKVVLSGNVIQSSDEIKERYRLPRALAEWYACHGDFFSCLRAIRDRIVHHGASVDIVFETDRGFAVDRQNDPFGGLYDWSQACELPNGLVPLRPAMALQVRRTIDACDDFAAALSPRWPCPTRWRPTCGSSLAGPTIASSPP